MRQKYFLENAIDKHRYAYYDLVNSDIRLDKEIRLMKKRIAKIAVDEVKYQARQQFLDSYLAELKDIEEQFQTSGQPEKYKRRKLKQLQKEIDKTRGRWYANRWHLSVVYKNKRKDNVVKLLLKENKQAEIQVRIQQTKQTLELLLQEQQAEQAIFNAYAEKVLADHVKEADVTETEFVATATEAVKEQIETLFVISLANTSYAPAILPILLYILMIERQKVLLQSHMYRNV
ncbi:hypothetical protein [Xanthocytophaga flava]|uniref:hypothetical protein n=1 Tax=Xanthocytophaga flava TaxID=3048013 RepID=UPI0028D2ACFF|nr:hypothetical protein [Xanthocytophaga flavus]MDJ1473192.1 hypothetical protein [Xanthocytophaga flavus]